MEKRILKLSMVLGLLFGFLFSLTAPPLRNFFAELARNNQNSEYFDSDTIFAGGIFGFSLLVGLFVTAVSYAIQRLPKKK